MNEVRKSLSEVTVRCLSAVPKVRALQARAQATHDGPADVAVKDIVNERIDTAVGKGQGPTHLHAQLKEGCREVQFLLQARDNSQEFERVKGQPGKHKSCHHNQDDLDGFPQLFVMLS